VTFPPLDEPSQPRRAVVYGRGNQASAHYRPLRKGRPMPDTPPISIPSSREARAAYRRRLVLFVLALIVAIASGTAIFGVVLANPATTAQAPQVPTPEAPEPAIQPLPQTGRGAPIERAPSPPPGSAADDAPPGKVTTTTPAAKVGDDAVERTPPTPSPTVYYQNCNKAHRAGAAPLYPEDPGYRDKLDKDGNGIACDEK